jgi:choline dehydrogenase-like flavoprotein
MASIAVIGSGHAGIAAALMLVEKGYRPIILDVGETLEPERQEIVNRLSGQPKSAWNPLDVAEITRNATVRGKRPKRLMFGSDFVYADRREAAPLDAGDEGPSPTFAQGGFSGVWGAAMLPADDCDMTDWPVKRADLVPYYKRVLNRLPLSAAEDPLSRRFPLYRAESRSIELAPLERSFLDSLLHSHALRDSDDVAFGQARLAVRAADDQLGAGCVYCGLCLSGCVYGSIYSTSQELIRLQQRGEVDYRPHHLVVRLHECADRVRVTCRVQHDRLETLAFDQVFLAAGAINSTRIMLESKQIYNQDVNMKTTQGYILPMLRLRGAPFVWPQTNTLCAVFFEFKVAGGGDHWVHTQISAANELVMARLGFHATGGGSKNRVLKSAFRRLLIALVTFHSDLAGSYRLRLCPAAEGEPSTLVIRSQPSPEFPHLARRAARQLARHMLRVGVLPLLPLIQGGLRRPSGWHYGGAMPMSARPRGYMETDVLGRPVGWSRVHVVDSSVFPSLPSTTIALLAMANAQRIVDAAISARA